MVTKIIILAAVVAYTQAITLSASTDFKVYYGAMLGESACDSITKNSKKVPIDKTCGRSGNCNYPDQICVQDVSSFFGGNSYSCVSVPSGCQNAVKGSGGGGGNQTQRPTQGPTQGPTQRPTQGPTAAPPSGGGQDPKCKESFGVRGSFASGARPSRVYGWNGRSCESFVYMGSRGNGNNFPTEAACNDACAGGSSAPAPPSGGGGGNAVCNLPPKAGIYTRGGRRCGSLGRKYSYNASTRQCEFFFFSGCDGNANQFDSKTDCERACKN